MGNKLTLKKPGLNYQSRKEWQSAVDGQILKMTDSFLHMLFLYNL